MAIELEKHLILNRYFLQLFGVESFNSLREKLKDTREGFDTTGRSYFIDVLIGLKPEWEDSLLKYDEAIRNYVEKLRRNRKQPNFNLKYFQYLAVLFTEIFLDRYFNDKERFLNELKEFSQKFNIENGAISIVFTEEELKKLAFWMATGSGKTLIMHINYWQILKYSRNIWDNIILITPNEGLSKQHYKELKLSGIPCKLYDGNIDSLKTRDGEVLIIDIHKLTKEKTGEGTRVDISYFDGKNLVFIDEGHKGQKSEEQKWKKLRDEIGKNGFLFEYSATFGQIIGQNKELLKEYSKAIIFDYSYKFFYTDGYGKDFYVYNIQTEKSRKGKEYSEEQQNLLLLAGLLTFYEQLEIFENHKEELREYNIEKPLWIFVGSKVTGKGLNSDIVKVVQFLNKITSDRDYLKSKVRQILNEKLDDGESSIFKGKFKYIKENQDIDSIVRNIYQKVFGGEGKIEIYELKSTEGELGLKTSTAEKYFGVINVGDVRPLKKLLSEAGIEVKQDHFSQSLFFRINESDSPVSILIGSKKFIEGWNSWRVSSMGLINIGKSEGPQIIQLFGRGVRLKGRNFSLKREENPDYKLKMLQTLFIFGLNANYINAFLSTIEREGVDYREITIPIKFNNINDWEGKIYILQISEDFDFLNYPVKLSVDVNVLRNVELDLRPRITIAHGLKVKTSEEVTDKPVIIPEEYFDFIDWNYIYSEITNYKITKGMYNLIIDLEVLKEIVRSREYRVFLSKTEGIEVKNAGGRPVLRIKSFEGVKKFQDIVLLVLKSYIQKFFRREEKRKAMNYLKVEPLKVNRHSFMFPENKEIILKIPERLKDEIAEVVKQLREYDSSDNRLPEAWKSLNSFAVHLDNHLYTPLIVWEKDKEEIKSFPVKLNRGETRFIKDFKIFLDRNKELFKNKSVFMLRNLSKRGIGFFIHSGFYPDFIIWVVQENKQNMIFIDPKGIRNLGNFKDDKVQFCVSYIKEIEKEVNKGLKRTKGSFYLQMDAFILSVSPYYEVKSVFGEGNHSLEEFEEHNILFQESYSNGETEYLRKIFKRVGVF